MIIPVSAVVPTRDRAQALSRTLESLSAQGVAPAELIVVDGSEQEEARDVVAKASARLASGCNAWWAKAERPGAATQRIQGVSVTTQPFVWFFDDDILFEPECVVRMWTAISSDPALGGINAMIVNQKYASPGLPSRTVFWLMHGRRKTSYAGRVIGPAINLLPEDRSDLPEVVPVEWLNTTCAIYRRRALPNPVFDAVFAGYSLFEDVALSLRVGAKWRLANARTARIFHDSQPGAHKANAAELAEMELVNRHYVMTKVLGRNDWRDYAKLLAWETFGLAASLASSGGRRACVARLGGKARAIGAIVRAR
jgi:glycosyltransferase involved in cell wall biosynthesis